MARASTLQRMAPVDGLGSAHGLDRRSTMRLETKRAGRTGFGRYMVEEASLSFLSCHTPQPILPT